MSTLNQCTIEKKLFYIFQAIEDPEESISYAKMLFNDSRKNNREGVKMFFDAMVKYILLYVPGAEALKFCLRELINFMKGEKKYIATVFKICNLSYTNDIAAIVSVCKTPKEALSVLSISEDLLVEDIDDIDNFDMLSDDTIHCVKELFENPKINTSKDLAIISLMVRNNRNYEDSCSLDMTEISLSDLKAVSDLKIDRNYIWKDGFFAMLNKEATDLDLEETNLNIENLINFKDFLGIKNNKKSTSNSTTTRNTKTSIKVTTMDEEIYVPALEGYSNNVSSSKKAKAPSKSKNITLPPGEKYHSLDENGWFDNRTLTEESNYRWGKLSDDEKAKLKKDNIDSKHYMQNTVKVAREKRGALPPKVFHCDKVIDHKDIKKMSPLSCTNHHVFELNDGSVAFVIKQNMKNFVFGSSFDSDIKPKLCIKKCKYEIVLCDATPVCKPTDEKTKVNGQMVKEITYIKEKCNMVYMPGDYSEAFTLNDPKFKTVIEENDTNFRNIIFPVCRIIKYRWIFRVKDSRNGIFINKSNRVDDKGNEIYDIMSFGEIYTASDPALFKEWLKRNTNTKFLYNPTHKENMFNLTLHFENPKKREAVDDRVDENMKEFPDLYDGTACVYTKNSYEKRNNAFHAMLSYNEDKTPVM